jgi:hypothetical protein
MTVARHLVARFCAVQADAGYSGCTRDTVRLFNHMLSYETIQFLSCDEQ